MLLSICLYVSEYTTLGYSVSAVKLGSQNQKSDYTLLTIHMISFYLIFICLCVYLTFVPESASLSAGALRSGVWPVQGCGPCSWDSSFSHS